MDPTTTDRPHIQHDVRTIDTWEKVDVALGVLRRVDASIRATCAEYDEPIQELQAAKAHALAPLLNRRERVEEMIAEFAAAHRGDLPDGRRSMKLVHGTLGWKKGNVTVEYADSAEETLQRLAAHGHDDCIVTKTTIQKTALKALSPVEAELCGITLVQTDRFYLKLHDDPPVEYPVVDDEDDDVAAGGAP